MSACGKLPLNSTTDLLQYMQIDDNGIYSYQFSNIEQTDEMELRENIAQVIYKEPLDIISKNHSIPVMDYEVRKFLKQLPPNAKVIDVGGCWGWHWRHIKSIRPDVNVLIVDFIKNNLLYAKTLLGELINSSVFLIHGDATDLRIPDECLDGYWSVQTLQHINQFEKAINESYRILKKEGVFFNYSLNDQPPIRLLYRLLKRNYIVKGQIDNYFYLARASKEQKEYVEKLFKNVVIERWSEVLFKPELRFTAPGKIGSWFGYIDVHLSNNLNLFSSVARQKSFHCIKK